MSRAPIITTLAAAALIATGCGSSGADSPGNSVSKQNAGLVFANCMRTHGVPSFPDPGSNASGGIQIQAKQRAGSGQSLAVNGVPVAAPAFQSAMQYCRRYLPNGGHPSAAQAAAAKTAALAMSRCMRSHGVPNFPDPTFRTGPGGGIGIGIELNASGIDPSSPAFRAAQKICMPNGAIGVKQVP
jgi:hypothetical protein